MKKNIHAYPWLTYISNYMKYHGMGACTRTTACKGCYFSITGRSCLWKSLQVITTKTPDGFSTPHSTFISVFHVGP